jgi:hypothetical protein
MLTVDFSKLSEEEKARRSHSLNEKYLGSSSNKLRRVPYIESYLCELIDNDQRIKRLCRYLTYDPLELKAYDYDNNPVDQPDLQDSLMFEVVRDNVSPGTEGAILDNHMFTSDIMESSKVMIFVYCSDVVFSEGASKFGSSSMGFQLFTIDIVYPLEVDRLCDGLKRSWAIATVITDLVDQMSITDSNYVKYTGNVKFEFKEQRASNKKLAPNTDLGILSIPFVVSVPSGRI